MIHPLRVSWLSLGAAFASFMGAAVALGGGGCTQVRRDFSDSGSSTSTGGGGQGGGDVTASDASSSASGAGGSEPQVCLPGQPPYVGPLCGAEGAPCKAIVDEIVEGPTIRQQVPSIALDPSCGAHVLYSTAYAGDPALYASRVDVNTWQTGALGFPSADGGHVIGADGIAHVLINNSAVLSLWHSAKDSWAGPEKVTDSGVTSASGLAIDDSGTLHMAYYTPTSPSNPVYARQMPNGLSTITITDTSSIRNVLAVTPEGAPHLVYWSSDGEGKWILKWVSPPGAPEIAMPLGSNSLDLDAQAHRLAVTPPDAANPKGRPHVLAARRTANGAPEIVHVTRDGSSWIATSLETLTGPTQNQCYTMKPSMNGQVCDFDYEELWPVAAVAGRGGDVRLFYAKHHRTGSMFANGCDNLKICSWYPAQDTSSGELIVAWANEKQVVTRATVLSPTLAINGTGVVDTAGIIHLAFYDTFSAKEGSSGKSVRYVQVGF